MEDATMIHQKIPFCFCAQKNVQSKNKTRPNQLEISDPTVSIIGRPESIIQQTESKGAFIPWTCIKMKIRTKKIKANKLLYKGR